MEYCYRSLDPRDLRGDDINFYLTGTTLQNDAELNAHFTTSQAMLFNGARGGVLYRQAIMRKPPNNGIGYIIDLADIMIPGGVIRVDRARMAFEHELTLGHYGLPHVGGAKARIEQFEDQGKKVVTASIAGRSVALILHGGWDGAKGLVHGGRNAEADESTVVYAHRKRTTKNPAMELMIAVMLHKRDNSPWSAEELSPIRDIAICDIMPSGSPMGAVITLRDGTRYEVDFANIDGNRTC
jgi:hypothetical protein